jgi:hypothetical protein
MVSKKAAKAIDATFTVRGIISNGPEPSTLRFVQDAELALYALPTCVPGYDELRTGDSLQRLAGDGTSHDGAHRQRQPAPHYGWQKSERSRQAGAARRLAVSWH